MAITNLNSSKKSYSNSLDYKIFLKIFENIPLGIGVFNIEDLNDLKSIRYVFMNDVILNEMRKTREEVIGKTIYEVTPEAYSITSGFDVIQSYFQVAREQKSIDLGKVVYENEISSGIYECSIHPLFDNFIYVKLNNITELVNTQVELLENQSIASINGLISGLSHEINNPLNYISGSLDVLKKNLNEKDFNNIKIKRHFEYAKEGVGRISSIIKKLKLLNDQSSEFYEECNPNECIESALGFNSYRIDSRVKVIKELSEEKFKINANKNYLGTTFLNIINNALEAMDQNDGDRILKIKTNITNDFFEIAVTDNGSGIAKENIDKIKDPFFSTKDPTKGVGLGLTFAYKYLKTMHGKLEIKSTIGVGSTFTIKIPSSNLEILS